MGHKTIKWDSERKDHKIIATLFNTKVDIIKLCLADLMDDYKYEIPDTENVNGIRYHNSIVPGQFIGVPSNISIGATALLMCSFGDFPIPQEILDYITEEYDNDRVDKDSFPNSKEDYENGKRLIEAFIELDMPYYAACAIAGATWVESHWNVHAVNSFEYNGNGVGGTSGWAGCGEGLFQLTGWSQKSKIIKKLLLPGLPPNMESGDYERNNKHLCDCTEEEWIEILKAFLQLCVDKHKDILCSEDEPTNDEDRTNILCSSYLFKAAPGKDCSFDNVKETAEVYMRTHTEQAEKSGIKNYNAHNGFAFQVYVSIMLDKYLHGEDLDIDLHNVGKPNNRFNNNLSTNIVKQPDYKNKTGNSALANEINKSVEHDKNKDVELEKQGENKEIHLKVVRNKKLKYKEKDAAYGKLYVDGVYFCDTIENDLIKPGKYTVAWREDQGCTKLSDNKLLHKAMGGDIMYKYISYSKGFVPSVKGVTGRYGIKIIQGKGISDSGGSLIVGKLTGLELFNSWGVWKQLYDLCYKCKLCTIEYIE